MGWLLGIYLLENMSILTILKFFRIGIMHSNKDKIFGIILGIWKFDLRFTFGVLKEPEIDKGEAYA